MPDVDAALHISRDTAHVKVPGLPEQPQVLEEHGRRALAQTLRHYQLRVLSVLFLYALPAGPITSSWSAQTAATHTAHATDPSFSIIAPALGNVDGCARFHPCVVPVKQWIVPGMTQR